MLKLVDAISKHNILADSVESMESMGELNREVAYVLRTLGLKNMKEVREEIKRYR